jgi:hypothetical protein
MPLQNLRRHTVDWERPYTTVDDSRGSVRTFQTERAGIRCLIQPITGRDRLLYAQRNIVISHKIYFTEVLDLAPGDRFYKAASGGLAAKVYVVSGWFDQGGQGGRCFCVEAKETT